MVFCSVKPSSASDWSVIDLCLAHLIGALELIHHHMNNGDRDFIDARNNNTMTEFPEEPGSDIAAAETDLKLTTLVMLNERLHMYPAEQLLMDDTERLKFMKYLHSLQLEFVNWRTQICLLSASKITIQRRNTSEMSTKPYDFKHSHVCDSKRQ